MPSRVGDDLGPGEEQDRGGQRADPVRSWRSGHWAGTRRCRSRRSGRPVSGRAQHRERHDHAGASTQHTVRIRRGRNTTGAWSSALSAVTVQSATRADARRAGRPVTGRPFAGRQGRPPPQSRPVPAPGSHSARATGCRRRLDVVPRRGRDAPDRRSTAAPAPVQPPPHHHRGASRRRGRGSAVRRAGAACRFRRRHRAPVRLRSRG